MLNEINCKQPLISNAVYGRWHSKLFTNCHVSWDTLYVIILVIFCRTDKDIKVYRNTFLNPSFLSAKVETFYANKDNLQEQNKTIVNRIYEKKIILNSLSLYLTLNIYLIGLPLSRSISFVETISTFPFSDNPNGQIFN